MVYIVRKYFGARTENENNANQPNEENDTSKDLPPSYSDLFGDRSWRFIVKLKKNLNQNKVCDSREFENNAKANLIWRLF